MSTNKVVPDDEYRVVALNAPSNLSFCSNKIVTSHYTPIDFLPKFLFYSFTQLANAYFLMVSVMQCIPAISNTNGFPTTAPGLVLILMIDAVFQIMEDLARHRADAEANNRGAHILNKETKSFEEARWVDITVGSVIKIFNKEPVPADVLLLACAKSANNPEGICNVETKELDGETNLKPRLPLPLTASQIVQSSEVSDLIGIQGSVRCELPNQFINKFSGTLEVTSLPRRDAAPGAAGEASAAKPVVEPIDLDCVVLRGSTVHSAEYVFGLVLNTGVDTKIMQNMRKPEMKQSTIDKQINMLIIFYICVLIFMCSCGAIGSSVWNHNNMANSWYFKVSTDDFWLHKGTSWEVGETVVTFFYFFLISSQFISLVMYVSITIVKSCQSYFMMKQLPMYHDKTDTPMLVRTMSLNDELGVISHVFSDKTGTLTDNVMEFRKCSIGGVVYGKGTTEIGIARMKRLGIQIPDYGEQNAARAPHVNFNGPELMAALEAERGSGKGGAQPCHEFFTHLAVCHSIIIDDAGGWSAQSPDELALVSAADFFGFKFVGEQKGIITVSLNDGSERKFEKLDEFTFTSARKRMSVVVRDLQTKKIVILAKGADNVMWRRTKEGAEMAAMKETMGVQLADFGDDGLRTLVIAMKEVGEAEYTSWKAEYAKAVVDLDEIEKKKEDKPNKIDDLEDVMERDFVLIGSTAIEDKLQDGVPKCIADLAIAGISTWMLTGDKEETAINIAHACLLLDTSMSVVVINYNKFPTLADVRNELVGRARQIEQLKEAEDAKGLVGGARQKFALVIDGDALAMVMAMDDKGGYVGCQAALLRYVQHCVAVVACRCAPSQKAEIVRLVRDNIDTCRSLAIGDGANDVPMIQEAHVGVGISGHEGLQAVNSSDFAIAQFRFLQELLLVQGRHNYRRMSLLVHYLFYKNVMMVLTQYWFTIANTGVSGQKFNPEFGTQAFNVVWTFPMVVIAGIFDKDTSDEASRNFPQMYNLGIQNYYFSRDICLRWFFDAIIESLLVCFVTISAIDNLSIDGQDAGLWMTGGHTFSIIIFTVNLKLFLHQHRWHWLMFAVWAAVTLFWIPCCIIGSIENTFTSENWSNFAIGWYGLWWKLQTLPGFWLLMVLVPFILLAPQALRCLWRRYMYPEITDLVGEFELFKISDAEQSLLDWKIVAPPPPQVRLEGWNTGDESVISGLGPLPLGEARPPATTQQGPSSATLLAPVPNFAGAR